MGRPRSFDTDAVLDRIVDTFWEHGYASTSMQALCEAAGLNPGSLYAAFGDKRTLFVQAMDRYMRTVSQQTVERLNGNASGLAGLHDYFDTVVTAMVEGKRRWGCLVTNSVLQFAIDEDADLATTFRLHLARLETAFAGAIERARRAGELPPGPPAAEGAAYLACLLQGLNVLARTQPGRAALASVVQTALGALGAPAPARA